MNAVPAHTVRGGLTALVAATLLTGAVSACSDSETAEEPTEISESAAETEPVAESTDDAYVSEVYSEAANWLCRPDIEGDACDVDLDATLVEADGSQTAQPFEPAADAPVDCFYVYPTISTDQGQNSDLQADDAERSIAANQAARFGEVCNVYAPTYRQVPLAALFDRISSSTTTTTPGGGPQPWEIAYADVLDAFRHYLANDNGGRPFVLVGHSQGAGHLRQLVAEEIDGDEDLRGRMLSAMLIGSSVEVSGEDAFENVPACGDLADTGCVVSYATFLSTEPPPPNSLFGRPRDGEGTALCSNPASLGGDGDAPLSAYFPAGHAEDAPEVPTPWIRYDGLITGECVTDGTFNWLEITSTHTDGDARPADLGGRLTPEWGLHLLDVNLAMGNLVELVRSQSGQA